MPNIHNISSKDILKFLLEQGFIVHHQKGSHIQLKKDFLKVTIPNHGNKILNIKTILSILRQSNVNKNQFFK